MLAIVSYLQSNLQNVITISPTCPPNFWNLSPLKCYYVPAIINLQGHFDPFKIPSWSLLALPLIDSLPHCFLWSGTMRATKTKTNAQPSSRIANRIDFQIVFEITNGPKPALPKKMFIASWLYSLRDQISFQKKKKMFTIFYTLIDKIMLSPSEVLIVIALSCMIFKEACN